MSETDLAEVWARSLEELATMQIEPHQRAWLKLTRPLGLVENTALIATPNEFVKEQLETRLRALITHALSRELGRSIQLAVTVDPTAITAATAFPPPRPIPARRGQHGSPMATAGCPARSAARWASPDEWPGPAGRGPPGRHQLPGRRHSFPARPPGAARAGDPRGGPGDGQFRPPGILIQRCPAGPIRPPAGRRWAARSTRWQAPQHAAGPPRPRFPGLPRPGSIPSTPSRPS